MATIALLFGSTFGAFGGLLGWLLFGLSGTAALTLYFAMGLLFPALCLVVTMLTGAARKADTRGGTVTA